MLLVVLDQTTIGLALPSIRDDLQLDQRLLVWVVNAHLLTFGGVLLLGGRLGDVYGHRRVFLVGIALFVLAAAAGGLALAPMPLVAARAVQGLGGGLTVAVALSLTMATFSSGSDRARAVALYGFMCYGGSALGVLLGGVILTALSWRWILLLNVPFGAITYVLCLLWLPKRHTPEKRRLLDVGGAITLTASLMLLIYLLANGPQTGWASIQSVSTLVCATILILVFLAIEMNASTPLIPITLVQRRNVVLTVLISLLWAASARTWSFMSPLYMQSVLGSTPMHVALVFLPCGVLMAGFSIGVSAKLVNRYGARTPLTSGMLLNALGLMILAWTAADASSVASVLPSMVLIGIGTGILMNPIIAAAMNGVPPEESSLVSGILNTASLLGGAVGFAISAALAAARTNEIVSMGAMPLTAATAGYRSAFLAGGVFAFVGALLSAALLPSETRTLVEDQLMPRRSSPPRLRAR